MNDIAPDKNPPPWPLGLLSLIFLFVAFLWILAVPTIKTTHSVFIETMGFGVFAIFILRTALAAVRKERGWDWVFYVAFLITIPILVHICALTFVPLASPFLH